jgi:hypothetical protein
MAVGPPIGTVIWFAVASFGHIVSKGSFNFDAAKEIVTGILIGLGGMPAGYVFGLVPAAVSGIVIGAAQVAFGRLHWPIVLAIGTCVGIRYLFSLGKIMGADFFRMPGGYGVPILTCMAATFLCWGFVQNWYLQSGPS